MKLSITFWRRIAQAFFFVLFVYGAVIFKTELDFGPVLPKINPPEGMPSTTRFDRNTILWASDDPPVIDAYPPAATCRFNPKGGLVKACIVHMVSENLTWRTKIAYILPAFIVFIISAFLLGRWWCGWVCPLGTVGDALTFARRKLKFHYIEFSHSSKKLLRGTGNSLLWGGWGISYLIGFKALENVRCYLFLPYCQICPGRLICPVFGLQMPSWRDFSSTFAGVFTVIAWLMLALFLAAFVVGRRVWCRVCPIGHVISWFNRGALLELRKDPQQCNRCGACADACPMANTHVRDEKKERMNHPDCIFCLRCVEQCPNEKCLSVGFSGVTLASSSLKPRR